jgi:hypothetical protein
MRPEGDTVYVASDLTFTGSRLVPDSSLARLA